MANAPCGPTRAGQVCGNAPCALPPSSLLCFPANPRPQGQHAAPCGGPYGPCTPSCGDCCAQCCTLNTPIPRPCCTPNQLTPCGPCPLEPPQMMVCYRRPCSSVPGKEEYQCFPAYYKLPDLGNSPCNLPQPYNPLPPCCPAPCGPCGPCGPC